MAIFKFANCKRHYRRMHTITYRNQSHGIPLMFAMNITTFQWFSYSFPMVFLMCGIDRWVVESPDGFTAWWVDRDTTWIRRGIQYNTRGFEYFYTSWSGWNMDLFKTHVTFKLICWTFYNLSTLWLGRQGDLFVLPLRTCSWNPLA